MPSLTWSSKTQPETIPASIHTDSIIYPHGEGYPFPQIADSQASNLPPTQPSNRLILGENLAVMSALLPEYEGRIHLIYADPPFFTNRKYKTRIGRGEDSRRPEEWELADGYADHWANIDAYLDMLYPRLHLMHRLLAPNGTLYLHLDWHADHYARLLLDEIFGADRLLNEIIWVYHGPSPIRSAFNRKHDTILSYTKRKGYTFNVDDVRVPYNPSTVKTFASSSKAGFGKVPDLKRGKVPEDWWYFPVVARLHNERTGYPTQKPEALLERIILASSNPGEIVADFFCGAGTAPVVAARLGRRFIASDLKWRAVHTTRSRLVDQGGDKFAQPVFSFQKEKRAVVTDDPGGNFTLLEPPVKLSGQVLEIDPEFLPELDYWEVDPGWDGVVFQSASQAVRPRRKGDIPAELSLPFDGETVCVRLVLVNGEQIQFVVGNS